MSNEELARQIQQGERGLILSLWEQVRRYAQDRAYKWFRARNGGGGQTVQDLEQAAFLALLDALEGWKSAEGQFPHLVRPAAEIGLHSGHRTTNKAGSDGPAPEPYFLRRAFD